MNLRPAALISLFLFTSAGVAADAELKELREENEVLHENIKRLIDANVRLRKQNAELKEKLDELIGICKKHGIQVTVARPEPPRKPAPKRELSAAQRDVLAGLRQRVTEKEAGEKLEAWNAVARTLAELGQTDACLAELRSIRTATVEVIRLRDLPKQTRHHALWSFAKTCGECAAAFASRWQEVEPAAQILPLAQAFAKASSLAAMHLAVGYVNAGDALKDAAAKAKAYDLAIVAAAFGTQGKASDAAQLAGLCEQIAKKSGRREHKQAALLLYQAAVAKDASLGDARARVQALEKELGQE
jgi:regulator of replication initiation timing